MTTTSPVRDGAVHGSGVLASQVAGRDALEAVDQLGDGDLRRASRRQNLFLKRLRSTAADDTSVLSGLLLPVTVMTLVQVAVILGVLGAVSGEPAQVLLLVAAVLSIVIMMLGLGLATAGLTNSPEHAQVTTLPVSLGTIAIASWVGISGSEELTVLKRLLPRRLGHRAGGERLGWRHRRVGFPGAAGAHAELDPGRRRAGVPALPLGAAPVTTPVTTPVKAPRLRPPTGRSRA